MCAQRWNVDLEHLEPVHQIGTKVTPLDLLFQIAVGGSDDAHVDLTVHQRTESANPQVFNHPQQLGLQAQIQFSDFIKEQSAAVGSFNQADLARVRVGEGAFLEAEQLTLNQVGGQCRAVDLDERRLGAGAALVAGARHEFLAGASFTQHQNRGSGRLIGWFDAGYGTNQIAQLLHRR